MTRHVDGQATRRTRLRALPIGWPSATAETARKTAVRLGLPVSTRSSDRSVTRETASATWAVGRDQSSSTADPWVEEVPEAAVLVSTASRRRVAYHLVVAAVACGPSGPVAGAWPSVDPGLASEEVHRLRSSAADVASQRRPREAPGLVGARTRGEGVDRTRVSWRDDPSEIHRCSLD